jgi:hypothetical protein
MIPIITSHLSSKCYRLRQRAGRSLLLLPLAGCVLACVSCTDQSQPIVDLTPLASALRVIAYAVVGAAVLSVLGKLIK